MNATNKEISSGLLLRADAGFTVKLYLDFAGEEELPAAKIWEEQGKTCYYYENFRGRCRYKISGEGCYALIQNLYIPEEPKLTTMEIATQRCVGGGFEPERVKLYSPGILENAVPSHRALWPQYQDVFQSPYFRSGKAGHQITTQQEMEAYIAEVGKNTANMYSYTLGKSPKYGYCLPIVIFTKTDLTGAQTLEEAAARVRENGKLTVHYQAQIHGNEPAGGEAALAMIGILAGSWGEKLQEHMNIYVIPRLNPDGAKDFNRKNAFDVDMNRDMLSAQFVETQLQHKVLNLFEPEVCLDSHEYTTDPERTEDSFRDMMIASGWSADCPEDFIQLTEEIARVPFAPLFSQGMQPSYYIHCTNRKNPLTGTRYMGLRRAVAILLESRGSSSGLMTYERRVTAHVISVKAILSYVLENHAHIRDYIRSERKRIADAGSRYDEKNIIVLQTQTQERPALSHPLTRYDTGPGTVTEIKTIIPKSNSLPVRTRPLPTAYVIPVGESWTAKVLEILAHHGIPAEKLAEGTTLRLQQYTGTTEEAQLTEEKQVTFPKGAYFCPMNQVGAFILATLMEPDLNDAYSVEKDVTYGTLAQAGYIPAAEGSFPIYRYIRDLDPQWTVEPA